MKRRKIELQPLGKRFGRSDLDRVGFFHDPSPAPFDKYEGIPVVFREGIEKGRQMLSGPPSNVFETKFVRIFDGEALQEPWRLEAQQRLQDEKAKIGDRLMPSSPAKKHSTPGDYHGCFEKISYFSPQLKPDRRQKTEPEPPNMKTSPNPRGGPGYADICLNPFPSYTHELFDPERKRTGKPVGRFLNASAPLDYFPPNPYDEESSGPTYVRPTEVARKMIGPGRIYVTFPKKPGGSHAGCFDKFPTHSSNPYEIPKEKKKLDYVFISGGPFFRTKYTTNIIDKVTRTSCNATNYRDYVERVYPLHK